MQNTANNQINKIISENVKKLIGGFSQSLLKAASAKTGVSARTIAYMISAEDSNPRLDTLAKFARGYRVELTELLKKDFGNSQYPPQDTNVIAGLKAAEVKPVPYIPRNAIIAEIVDCLDRTDKTGRAIVLDKARDVSREYPANKAKRQ